ncbi:MAG: hypothetical protein JHC25_08935 [Thermodesulfobacterium sp.]|jgi:hypothetical protein|nr:hypothetical protein [Thermodesulfobacterium sp.]
MVVCENVFVESYEVYDERVAGLVDRLKELRVVRELERVRVYEITPQVYLVVHESTEEGFSMDDYRYVVVWVDRKPVGMVVCKAQDCFQLLKKEELEELVKQGLGFQQLDNFA